MTRYRLRVPSLRGTVAAWIFGRFDEMSAYAALDDGPQLVVENTPPVVDQP